MDYQITYSRTEPYLVYLGLPQTILIRREETSLNLRIVCIQSIYSVCVYHIYIVKLNLGGGLNYYVDQIVRSKES